MSVSPINVSSIEFPARDDYYEVRLNRGLAFDRFLASILNAIPITEREQNSANEPKCNPSRC